MNQPDYPDLWVVLQTPDDLHDEDNRRGTFVAVTRSREDAFELLLEMACITPELRQEHDLFMPQRDPLELASMLSEIASGQYQIEPYEEFVSRWHKVELPASLRIENLPEPEPEPLQAAPSFVPTPELVFADRPVANLSPNKQATKPPRNPNIVCLESTQRTEIAPIFYSNAAPPIKYRELNWTEFAALPPLPPIKFQPPTKEQLEQARMQLLPKYHPDRVLYRGKQTWKYVRAPKNRTETIEFAKNVGGFLALMGAAMTVIAKMGG